jgi:hypothetical protein
MATRADLNNILYALDRLLKMFTIERYVYLALTAISFAILLATGYQLALAKEPNKELLGTVFGASGLISIAAARITWFFNRAFSLVEKIVAGANNE